MYRPIKRQASLIGRLQFCLATATIGIVGALFFSFLSSWQAASEAIYTRFSLYEAEMASQLSGYLASYQTTARHAGYSIAAQQYLLSDNPERVIRSYSSAYEFLTIMAASTAHCRNIYLYAANGRYICVNRRNIDLLKDMTKRFPPGLASFSLDSSFHIYRGEPGGSVLDKPRLFYLTPIYNILWLEPHHQMFCIIECDMEELTSNAVFSGDYPGSAAILLYNNSIISANRNLSIAEEETLKRIGLGRGRIRIGGEQYLSIKVSMAEQFWDYIYFIPEKEIITLSFLSMNKGIFILCAVVLLIILILALVIHSINTGIARIVEDLYVPEYNWNLSYNIRPHRLKELELITKSVGFLLERIKDSVSREQEANEKLLRAVTAQAQTEFMIYRSQINPHFLFNTLECMRSMTRAINKEGAAELGSMISSMARMFRYSIYAKPMVSLSMELDHVQNYMNVMNIRSENRYALKIKTEPEAEERLVPSMILQPLVENSITHGFSAPARGKCNILIQAYCGDSLNIGVKNKELLLRVSDNGSGIDPASVEELKSSIEQDEGREYSNALHNIIQRMKISSGENFVFDIKSKKGHYMVIEMHIPAEPELTIPEIK
ncbi:MAG: histidine kinase [Treponema sp.]|jgi:two-component system sensor histidine kinase YesM|nr:histidine kinase [Treponema sp.]